MVFTTLLWFTLNLCIAFYESANKAELFSPIFMAKNKNSNLSHIEISKIKFFPKVYTYKS